MDKESGESGALEQASDRSEAVELCIHCLKPTGHRAVFCPHCRAPLGYIAGTLPFVSIFAEGFIYRTAVREPKSLPVVLGVWMVFGYMALTGALYIWLFLEWAEYYTAWIADYYFLLYGGFSLIGISGVYQCTRNYLNIKNKSPLDESQSEGGGS